MAMAHNDFFHFFFLFSLAIFVSFFFRHSTAEQHGEYNYANNEIHNNNAQERSGSSRFTIETRNKKDKITDEIDTFHVLPLCNVIRIWFHLSCLWDSRTVRHHQIAPAPIVIVVFFQWSGRSRRFHPYPWVSVFFILSFNVNLNNEMKTFPEVDSTVSLVLDRQWITTMPRQCRARSWVRVDRSRHRFCVS